MPTGHMKTPPDTLQRHRSWHSRTRPPRLWYGFACLSSSFCVCCSSALNALTLSCSSRSREGHYEPQVHVLRCLCKQKLSVPCLLGLLLPLPVNSNGVNTPIVNLSLPVAGARQGGYDSPAAAASARPEQHSVKQHTAAAR